jgi:hypothetical protein
MNYISIFFILYSSFVFCQQSLVIEEPLINSTTIKIYLSENGSDNNLGDSLSPLKTFSEALNKIENLTINHTGEIFSEVVLFPGTYREIFRQPINKFEVNSRRLNVSLRGIDAVTLDGNNLTVASGSGMIHLLGSNISIRNLSVKSSNENGIRFGYNFNGKIINTHDIFIDNVEVSGTKGHGILLGIGALNANGTNILIPKAKRFKVTNCQIHDAVNYNTAQSQWGSALKFWNTSNSTASKNHIYDNSGEGIDFDFCDSAIVSENKLHDNYANIYLDKMQVALIEKNLIYNETKKVSGILLGIEAFTLYVTNHYMKDIFIENNIILNTTGINIWQGIYSAIQNASFNNIQIRYNTLIGKQHANGALISFSYETILGNPVANISFGNLKIEKNILSANPDSLNNNILMSAPLNPQPALTYESNLFNMNPGFGYNAQSDKINSLLPQYLFPNQNLIFALTPDSLNNNPFFFRKVNNLNLSKDYMNFNRLTMTNVGALESVNSTNINSMNFNKTIIFPNPSSKKIKISTQNSILGQNYSIINVFGETCTEGNYQNSIDIESLQPGIYFLRIDGIKELLRFQKK